MSDVTKVILREKFIVLNAYIRKEEKGFKLKTSVSTLGN